MATRALRGAAPVEVDAPEAIWASTEALLRALMEQNGLEPQQVISVIFTLTEDLSAAFPAVAARRLGLTDAALLCAREVGVPGSEPRLLRILMHAEMACEQRSVQHVYLGRAQKLRPDLKGRGS